MAVDTAVQRRSFVQGFLPEPDSALGTVDRKSLIGLFAFSATAVLDSERERLSLVRGMLPKPQGSVSLSSRQDLLELFYVNRGDLSGTILGQAANSGTLSVIGEVTVSGYPPPSGQISVLDGTNAEDGDKIQWETETQEGFRVDMNSDGTFTINNDTYPQTFDVRIFDDTDSSWSSWETITVVSVEVLVGSIDAVSSLSGSVDIVRNITGVITAAAAFSGALVIPNNVSITGTITATAGTDATLSNTQQLNGIIRGIASLTGDLRPGVLRMAGAVSGQSTTNANLFIPATMSVHGEFIGTVTLSGNLSDTNIWTQVSTIPTTWTKTDLD